MNDKKDKLWEFESAESEQKFKKSIADLIDRLNIPETKFIEPNPKDNDLQESIGNRYLRKLRVSPPQTLYHYTNAEALLSIVSSHSIRLTNLMYLNDSEEFSYAKGEFFKYLNENKLVFKNKALMQSINQIVDLAGAGEPGVSGICVGCFSELTDSLSMWRGYSPSSSRMCIGFKYPVMLEDSSPKSSVMRYACVPCVYDEKTQRRIIKNFISRCIWNYRRNDPEGPGCIENEDGSCTPNCGMFFPLCQEAQILFAMIKHPSFREEKEWRIIALMGTNISYRASSSIVVPYLSCNFIPRVRIREQEATNDYRQIDSITIGPSPHKELNKQAVKGLLDQGRFSGAKVVVSEIPFRDW